VTIVVQVLEIVAPVFILALIGFVWVKAGGEYRVQFVTRLAMTLSVPCLIFVSLMKTRIDPAALTELVAATLACYGLMTVAAFALSRAINLDARTYIAPIIFGNTGNLGLPLALFAFGEVGLGYAVVIFAVMAIISFTFGVWLVSGGGSVTKVFREPMVAATLLGGVFMLMGWTTPAWATNTLQLIGQMAIPLMLITLGVAVARLHPSGFARPVLVSLLKVIVAVGIAWSVGIFFDLGTIPFAVLVLQISTPVAVTSYLLAEKYDADADAVAGLVVASTLISVVAIPLTLAMLV